MTIQTRARRIRRALSRVAKRIPCGDWSGGALYPIFDNFGKNAEASRGRIVFNLPVCRLFSDAALVGLLAHECAHARVAASLGPHWHSKMQRRYDANERQADALAASWGFGAEIGALRQERRERLVPWFARHEKAITRHVARRMKAQEAKVRARFDALQRAQNIR
jgi:hypothetical protein